MSEALKNQQRKAMAAAHLNKIKKGPTVTELNDAQILSSAFFHFKEDDESHLSFTNLVMTGITIKQEINGDHTVTGEILGYLHTHRWLYTSTGWFRIQQMLPDTAARFVPPMITWTEAMSVLADTQKELAKIVSS